MILGMHSENPSADRRKFVKVWSSDVISFWPVVTRLFFESIGRSRL